MRPMSSAAVINDYDRSFMENEDVAYMAQPLNDDDYKRQKIAYSVPARKIPQKPVEIRKTFPETWIFDSFDFDSRFCLRKKV